MRRVFDSCACLGIIKGNIPKAPNTRRFISVIIRMELYAKPALPEDERRRIDALLADTTVVPLDAEVERMAIDSGAGASRAQNCRMTLIVEWRCSKSFLSATSPARGRIPLSLQRRSCWTRRLFRRTTRCSA